jgi:hypothetical protein
MELFLKTACYPLLMHRYEDSRAVIAMAEEPK